MISLASVGIRQFRDIACHHLLLGYATAEQDFIKLKVPKKQREPWHVAWLCRAMGDIAVQWRSLLKVAMPKVKLSFVSVFTHQSPKVSWPTGKASCELSDFLVAVIDRRTSPPIGRAIVVQAKMTSGHSVALSGTEKTQYDLLSKRPIFDLEGKNRPIGLDLSAYSPDNALMYGLASSGSGYQSCPGGPWLTADGLASAIGHYTVTSTDCLSSALTNLLQSRSGWQFDLPSTGLPDWTYFDAQSPRDDWTVLINYLLEETFYKILSSWQQIAAQRRERGADIPMSLVLQGGAAGLEFLPAFGKVGLLGDYADQSTSGGEGEERDWRAADLASAFGDGGGFGGGEGDEPGPPGNGPLSAIVFEIAATDE